MEKYEFNNRVYVLKEGENKEAILTVFLKLWFKGEPQKARFEYARDSDQSAGVITTISLPTMPMNPFVAMAIRTQAKRYEEIVKKGSGSPYAILKKHFDQRALKENLRT